MLQACAGRGPIARGAATPAEAVSADCVLPRAAEVLTDADGTVLKVWSFRLAEVHSRPVLPGDPGLLAYRAAVRTDGADVLRPTADPPVVETEEQARVWRDEYFNNDLAYSGEAGRIRPLTCLDALLFAEQNSRIPQLDRPTEFLASVLRKESPRADDVTIVFGAGSDLFPPKSVYGFDVVDRYLERGWTFWYVLHNHTLLKNGSRLALGTPVPSTSDVQFARGLAEARGLQAVRVTNGFYSFEASVEELSRFRAR